jgi:AmmeMemoRadiSam system protein A
MEASESAGRYDPAQRRIMLALARDAIEKFVISSYEINPPADDFLQEPGAAFVTLKKNEELRGCIGCTEPKLPLGKTIVGCAISAATRDPRFPPVSAIEVPRLQLEISVLSPFRKITNPEEIEVGVHGILLSFGYFRGLLLPQVAVEQGWDRDTFLKFTCRKAGLPADAYKSPNAQIEIFSAEVFGEDE